MLLEGQQIGSYHFLKLLGSGGMGDVYLAEDERIGQQVAIKVIRAELAPYPDARSSEEAARLFQREAKAIVKLDHPHILPLFAYGEEKIGDVSMIYLVMPYRPEGSLATWVRDHYQTELLAPADVAYLVRQAADALGHAHAHQIIHQDVKPSNFLLRHRDETPTRPDVFLADFGIARFMSASSSASLSIRGTPTYMAPEQCLGAPVLASDQYALAVMTYELLTGRAPFQVPPMQMMYQHINVPPEPPSALNPRLSKELDAALLYALAKNPKERFATITAFASALQNALRGSGIADASTIIRPITMPLGSGASPVTPVLSGALQDAITRISNQFAPNITAGSSVAQEQAAPSLSGAPEDALTRTSNQFSPPITMPPSMMQAPVTPVTLASPGRSEEHTS